MIKLCFSLPAVLQLAEHALAAPEHELSLVRRDESLPAVPALVWVKDDGTYLLSNGIPGLRVDADDPESAQMSVEAHGWGSGTRQELGHIEEIGGDDFAEYLELTDIDGNGYRLIDYLREGNRRQLPFFILVVHDLETFGWIISRDEAAEDHQS